MNSQRTEGRTVAAHPSTRLKAGCIPRANLPRPWNWYKPSRIAMTVVQIERDKEVAISSVARGKCRFLAPVASHTFTPSVSPRQLFFSQTTKCPKQSQLRALLLKSSPVSFSRCIHSFLPCAAQVKHVATAPPGNKWREISQGFYLRSALPR